MAVTINKVQPGEVISSDFMNLLLSQLADLEQRLSQLEAGGLPSGQVKIDHFDPPNQVAAGQVLSVFGSNFAFPPSDNQVTLDDTTIVAFRPDSTGSLLKFVVPTTLNVPAGGRNVKITITNSKGTAAALYRILPYVPAPGDDPVITGVVPVTGVVCMVDQPCKIIGQNFAANPTDNIITFQIMTGAGPQVYSNPQINAAQTNTTQIVVTVPHITEIPVGEGTRSVTLEVKVGAHVSAVYIFPVARSS